MDIDKEKSEDMKNMEQMQNDVNSANSASKITAGKNPKGEGKYVSQIKKNFANQSKTPESAKPPVKPKTSAGGVVSRLTAPTISSTNKSVKEDSSKSSTVSEKSSGKVTSVNGKNSPLRTSKENISNKKSASEKSGTKSHENSLDGKKIQGRKNSDNSGESKSVKKSEKGNQQNIVDTLDSGLEIITRSDNSSAQKHKPFSNTEDSTDSSSSLSLLEKRLKLKDQNKLEEKVAEETQRRGSSSDVSVSGELSLRQRFGLLDLSQGQTDSVMATAEPQVDQVGQPQGTEYVQISDHEIKCINTNFPVVSVQQNDGTTDVILNVGAENFKAHRRVLFGACKYFSPDMKENEVVELKGLSSKGITALLDYFYNGFVIVNPDKIEELIEGARFFHIEWLLDVCCDFLIQHLSLLNYPVVIQLTEKYWLGDLRWDIFVFFGQNLPELCQQENFYNNLAPELLLQFLMENVYCEATEFFVLDVVLKWVKTNEKDRKNELLALLRQIRFPIMEPEELEIIPNNVMQFTEIKEAIEDAENYSLNIMCQCLKNDVMYQQRGSKPVVAMLSFVEEGNIMVYRDPAKPTLFVEELGPTGIETVLYQTMSQAKIGNFLYAAGGYDGMYQSTAQVFRFDPKYRSWTEVAPMNESRVSFAMCSSDTKLYSVGGMSRLLVDGEETEKVHSSVEVYNPEENAWTPLQSLSVKTFDQAAAFHNGRLYVSGGISSDSADPMPLNTTWCLEIDGTDGWIQKQNMINERQGHSMTAYKDKLYVVGGYTTMEDEITFKDQLRNEVFDIETGQWTGIASTPEGFGHLFRYTGILCDKLFTIGGSNSNSNLYMYDPETDAWELVDEIGPNVQKLAILNVAYPSS